MVVAQPEVSVGKTPWRAPVCFVSFGSRSTDGLDLFLEVPVCAEERDKTNSCL